MASDVTALANLRMTLRDLMIKSPLCDGETFTLGLEQVYRDIWHRYCKGDVPSLKCMEMLQQQQQETDSQEASAVPLRVITSKDDSPPKTNGFNPIPPPPVLSLATSEESGAVS